MSKTLETEVEDYLDRVAKFIKENKYFIFYSVLGIILALIILTIYIYRANQNEQEAWYIFSKTSKLEKLEKLASRYSGTSAAVWMYFSIANQAYKLNQLEKALMYYEKILKEYSNHFLAPYAMMGKADVLEEEGKITEAQKIREYIKEHYSLLQ